MRQLTASWYKWLVAAMVSLKGTITPITNILLLQWFRERHVICLSLLDGGRVIVRRLSHEVQYPTVFLPTSNPISCASVYLNRAYERYV